VQDEIRLTSPVTEESWSIPIVFEDEHLLALNKPARLLTSPDRYDPERPNLMKLVHRDIERQAGWARARKLTYLANAHRLDFETSGVILLAKSKPILVNLANQFGSNLPLKTYEALVHGHPMERKFQVSEKIGPHPVRIAEMRIDPKGGKRAETEFEIEEEFKGYTLLQCRPTTGRTHQLRVHLKHVRLPIVGDALYGGKPLLLSLLKKKYHLKKGEVERPLIGRVALHAMSLEIQHPVRSDSLKMVAPLAKDFTVALKYLRKFGGGLPRSEDESVDNAS
jgi:23S rRNA pseudouridine1911/1915/1917 synthase